jgi:SSS family solute:Na+ symporter
MNEVSTAGTLLAQASFAGIDYAVLAVYLMTVVLIGSLVGRGQENVNDYFLAGRKMSGILVCVSIVATDLSAIGFIGTPAFVFERDLRYHFGSALMAIPVMIIIATVFVPIYHRLQVFTVYEYLEQRFHPLARPVAAGLFVLQRGVWLATTLYAPAVALAVVTGMPERECIFLIGVLATSYTVIGGMRAVIWTDFLQFFVLIGGLLIMCGVILAHFDWSIASVWTQASSVTSHKTGVPPTTMFDFSFEMNRFGTFWSVIFFMVIYNIGTYGTDQVVAQRYFTMGGLKGLVRTVITAGALNGAVAVLLAFFGILLVAFYSGNDALLAEDGVRNRLVPEFIQTQLPAGLRGLIIAAIFAATMSSVDSGLNSLTTVITMDLYKPWFQSGRQMGERGTLRTARIITVLLGVLATCAAVWISARQENVLQTVVELASKFIGPITGIFFLGILTRRGNIAGLFTGVAAGLTVSFLIEIDFIKEQITWLWTAPLSSLGTFLVGYFVSLLVPMKQHDATNPWTGDNPS